MAKSQRSKVMRRWRSLKRVHIENTKGQTDLKEINQKLEATILNRQYRQTAPKNGFLFPNDPEAVIPKHVPAPCIDFRSKALPYSGTQFSGANRKNAKGAATVVKTFILNEDEIQEEPIIEQEQEEQLQHEDPTDDLVNAMEGVKCKSKNEIKRERRQLGEQMIPLKGQKKTIQKSHRKKDAPMRKNKKIITF